MMSELPPDGGTPPSKPLELALAEEANAAIKSGANPGDVTAKLHQLISHFRANPDLAQQGQEALDAGIDPSTIAAKAYQHLQSSGPGRDFDTAPVQPTNVGALEHTALAVPFVAKATAAANAGMDQITGKKGTGTFGANYQNRLDASDAGDAAYRKAHPVLAPALSIAGNIAPIVATGGLSLGGTSLPMLARMGLGAAEGAGYGFIQGASDARHGDYATPMARDGAFGAVGGAAAPVVGTALGAAAKTLRIPNGVGRMADFIARQMPNSRVGQVAGEIAPAIGDRGAAASEVAQRVAQDNSGGFTPSAPVPGVPSLALDAGGPNVTALAGNIAGRPGAGGATITKALTERAAQMRPSVQGAFDQGTRTTAQDGEALLKQLANEAEAHEAAASQATDIGKQVAKVQGQRVPALPAPNALQAWRQQLGGNLANGIQSLRQYVSDRSAEAKQLFGAAREATQGQPMQSETLDQVMQTPAGKLAYKWALAQKGNRGSALPTVQGAVDESSPQLKQLIDLGVPPEKAAATLSQAAPTETAPDPETLHYMKQYLAKLSRLGVNDGAQGTVATQAQGALQAWGKIRSEMPEIWQQADEAFAKKSRVIDALNQGRNVMRTQLNPAGMKALHQSMDAIDQQMAKASPEEQQAFRIGAQSAVTDYLRSGGSPRTLATQLAEPTSAMSRRIAMATGDQNAPANLARALTPQAAGPQLIPAAPPIPALSSQAAAGQRGLKILGTGASDTDPNKTLAVLDRDAASMSPADRQALQRASAQAFRGEFHGAKSLASPGRAFLGGTEDAGYSPERIRQLEYAFPNSAAADQFRRVVAAWDAIAKKNQTILGGSPTMPRMAEEAARSQVRHSVALNLLSGNLGSAGKALVSNLSQGANSASRQRMDALIAEMLTGNNANALGSAAQTAARRAALQATLRGMLPTTGAAAANNLMPARQ